MDINLFLRFFSLFVLVGHSAFGRNPPSPSREGALGLKESISGRTPLERVLMSLSSSLTASGGGKWPNGNQFCSFNCVDAGTPTHLGCCSLLFAAGSNILFRIIKYLFYQLTYSVQVQVIDDTNQLK